MQPYYPPPGYYPPPPRSSGNTWWIVLLIVIGSTVLIVGILAVLAIAGVTKYLAAAKSAEARNTLGVIAMDASAAYEREDLDPTTLAVVQQLCPSASVPVPVSTSMVSGRKYQAGPTEWDTDAPTGGFACLKFEMYEPQYYQYNYVATGKGSRVGDSWTATARGDLDGDGTLSTFSMGGHIVSKGVLQNDFSVTETDPTE